MKTVVGVFDSNSEAQGVRDSLVAAGIRSEDIEIHSAESGDLVAGRRTEEDKAQGGGISGFFRRLFGSDEPDTEQAGTYSEAIRRGSCVVSAGVDSDADAERVESIMQQYGAIDIDERVEQWRAGGWTGYRSDAAPLSAAESEVERQRITGEKQTIPVAEEQLQVGKREAAGRGRVRIFTRIAERPVEETVRLREEHATVERHRVDRPATEADLAAMKEGTVEIRETAEEPVVAKTPRVVEEVEIGKEASERTETVRDTVRRTEVDVEEDLQQDVAKEEERGTTRRKGPGAGQRPGM